jgi:hypothetical protein
MLILKNKTTINDLLKNNKINDEYYNLQIEKILDNLILNGILKSNYPVSVILNNLQNIDLLEIAFKFFGDENMTQYFKKIIKKHDNLEKETFEKIRKIL